jgi:hypothetical protein
MHLLSFRKPYEMLGHVPEVCGEWQWTCAGRCRRGVCQPGVADPVSWGQIPTQHIGTPHQTFI